MNEALHWLSAKHINELLVFAWAFLLLDTPRYALAKWGFCLIDFIKYLFSSCNYSCCPSVTVLLAGHNEEKSIISTLNSIVDTYPRLEIIVIDDGSTDKMSELVKDFSSEIMILKRNERGGKASASNFGLKYASGEIIIVLDTDSTLGKNAIWEVVQPFIDKKVGAVSATILARNPFVNFITWYQAYEYLNSIFIGRIISSYLGILGIVSGAFGAFRKDILDQCMGFDVGPPEDLDMTIRIRKLGYKIAFAPYSHCYTDVPETWSAFTKQRRRWEQGGVVRNFCRKHVDMIKFDTLLWLETVYFELISPFLIVFYWIWLFFTVSSEDLFFILIWLWIFYCVFEFCQIIVLSFYSDNRKRDFLICLCFPFMIFYRSYLLGIRLISIIEEFFWRKSYEDDYVPKHVREKTWKF